MRILSVSPVPTHPTTAGNRARVRAVAEMLEQLGHEVHLLWCGTQGEALPVMHEVWGERLVCGPSLKRGSRWGRMRRRWLGRLRTDWAYTYGIDEWCPRGLEDQVRSLARRLGVGAVLVNYVFLSRALVGLPSDMFKLIDTHNVFALRHRAFLRHGERPSWYSTTRRGERHGLDRADVILAIESEGADHFRGLTRTPVVTVGHRISPVCPPGPEARTGDLLFVGSDNPQNRHGLQFFLDEVWSRIRGAVPGVRFRIVGAIASAVDAREGVVSVGRVPDLGEVYRQAAVVVNPVRFNTGLSIKNLEALGYARPLVTAAVGARGLERAAGRAFRVAEDARSFADEVVALLQDPDRRSGLAAEAHAFACSWNAEVLQQLHAALAMALPA